MNINNVNSRRNSNFLGHALPKHLIWFRRVNPKAVEEYFAAQGIRASFHDNKLSAALCLYAAKVVSKLGIPLPSEFVVSKTPKTAIAQSWFLRDRKPHIHRHLGVQIDKKYFSGSLARLDKRADSRRTDFGTTHFLNIPIHEIMHCDLFKKIGKKCAHWHACWDNVIEKKFSGIDISPFDKEIRKKIGSAAAIDALELHAVYWAKEICMALNSDLKPKYNPFQNPKIKLSPLLRGFINKISEADYNAAVSISRKAKKLQNIAQV